LPQVRLWLRTWQNWLPLALLLLTIALIFYKFFLGEVLYWGLPSLQFYPWREFAMSEFAQGRIPLWNPYNGMGAPLLANYQSALLYPPHLLYFLFPGPQMMGFLGMLHLAWAGYGMWRLTGRFKCPPLGRGIAALAYPLSTMLVARFGTIPMVDAAAWLPWLMLAVDALLDGATLARILALAAVLTMQLLAGHAQWTFYSFVLAGSYSLWKLLRYRRDYPLRRSAGILIGALLAFSLALGIAAAQLVPTAELQRQSQRASGVDETFALNFSFPPPSLINFLNPNFYGNPGDGTYAIKGAYFEVTAYLGILPLTLAVLGPLYYFLMQRRKRRNLPTPDIPDNPLIPFFSLVAVLSVILALGKFGIYPLLYRYVPTFNLFQAPARWLLLAVFSMAMLAAFAVPMWKPERRALIRIRIVLIGAISVTAAGIIAQLIMRSAEPLMVQMLYGVTVIGALVAAVSVIFLTQPADERHYSRWAIAVLVFVAADLWWANALSNPTAPASFYDRPLLAFPLPGRIFWRDPNNQQLPEATFDTYLKLNDYRMTADQLNSYRSLHLPNMNLLDRQLLVNNFDPLRPDWFDRYTRLLTNPTPTGLLLHAGAIFCEESFSARVAFRGDCGSPDGDRILLVPTAKTFNSPDAVEQFISAKDWDPAKVVAIETTDSIPSTTNAGTAKLSHETPQELAIDIDSPDGGMLVVADTYYPGWMATIDGNPTPIYRANLAFRTVIVPAGKHTVLMRYLPDSWRTSVLISLASLAVFVTLAIIALFRRNTR
jgi:hypothetical protein